MSHFKTNKSEINPKSTIYNRKSYQKSTILSKIEHRQSTIDNQKTPGGLSGRGLYHISMNIISFLRLLHP